MRMDLREYLKALRKYWWLIVLCGAFGAGAGVAVALTSTPRYQATVQFFAATPANSATNPLAGDQFGQQRVNSYTVLLSSQRLAKMILDKTQLKLSANTIQHSIAGTAELNTVLLTATVSDSDPARALEIAEAVATEMPAMVKEIESQGGVKTAPVALDVVSGPTLNPYPVSPRKKLDVGLGLAAGLVVGLIAAVLRYVLDTTVRTAEALQQVAGVPVLGLIGYDAAAKKQPIIVDTHARSLRAEAFRQLRTNLQFVDVERPASVIVVTSSTAGEGKSTTATNLAIAFAEADRKVLLIEADLRRPRVADYLGLERAIGLTNVLAGQVPVKDVLQEWGRGGLTVLPTGSIPPNPSELLGSRAMSELLAALRTVFDIVIIDTPPLLPVTDAAVASTVADGVVVVVRYGKTRKGQLGEAMEALHAVDARVLGAVLNMVPSRGAHARSGYRGYGYYEDDHGSAPKPPVAQAGVDPVKDVATSDLATGSEEGDTTSAGLGRHGELGSGPDGEASKETTSAPSAP